jgi:hypothetical protein
MIPLPRPPLSVLFLMMAESIALLSFCACLFALGASVGAPGAAGTPWTAFALQIACALSCLMLSGWARSRWRGLN